MGRIPKFPGGMRHEAGWSTLPGLVVGAGTYSADGRRPAIDFGGGFEQHLGKIDLNLSDEWWDLRFFVVCLFNRKKSLTTMEGRHYFNHLKFLFFSSIIIAFFCKESLGFPAFVPWILVNLTTFQAPVPKMFCFAYVALLATYFFWQNAKKHEGLWHVSGWKEGKLRFSLPHNHELRKIGNCRRLEGSNLRSPTWNSTESNLESLPTWSLTASLPLNHHSNHHFPTISKGKSSSNHHFWGASC